MYKLQFTLKQHTPLIHFQHDQAGATLRATEVKPKLDRFIIEKLTRLKGDEAVKAFKANAEWKKWLIGNGEHPALDYKMRITNSNPLKTKKYFLFSSNENRILDDIIKATEVDDVLSETPNFADSQYLKTKKINNRKVLDDAKSDFKSMHRGVYTSLNIKDNYLFSFHAPLLSVISKYFQEFFLINNFGYRQSKGFGSFTITEIRYGGQSVVLSDNIKVLLKHDVTHGIPKYDLQEVLKEVQTLHRRLKSGINIPGMPYHKAELFYEFADKNIRWDKRFIKKQINANKISGKSLQTKKAGPTDFYIDGNDIDTTNSFIDHSSNTSPYKFVRALLGLAEHYEYKIDKYSKYYVEIKHDNASSNVKIERFQSPILYKVIDGVIYPLPKSIPDELWGEDFEFSYFIKSNYGTPSAKKKFSKSIPIPKMHEFDLANFLAVSLDNIYKNENFELD